MQGAQRKSLLDSLSRVCRWDHLELRHDWSWVFLGLPPRVLIGVKAQLTYCA